MKRLILTLGFLIGLVDCVSAQNAIDVSIPTTSGEQNTSVTIPIQVGDLTGRNVFAYQATVTFDQNVLMATGASNVSTVTQPFGAPTVNTSVEGQPLIQEIDQVHEDRRRPLDVED